MHLEKGLEFYQKLSSKHALLSFEELLVKYMEHYLFLSDLESSTEIALLYS